MTKKPYVLFGAAHSMAYTQDELKMMVASILKNHIVQPRLSAEKNVKYQLDSDTAKSKQIELAAQFAYKLSSEETLQSLAANTD